MKTALIILTVIAAPSGLLILSSLSGAAFFGGTFLTCFATGYAASLYFSREEADDSKKESTNL